jgi:hypothetical protein
MRGAWTRQKAPLRGKNGPLHDEDGLLHDQNGPPHGEDHPLHGKNAPLHDEEDPLQGKDIPLHDENDPSHGNDVPLHDEDEPAARRERSVASRERNLRKAGPGFGVVRAGLRAVRWASCTLQQCLDMVGGSKGGQERARNMASQTKGPGLRHQRNAVQFGPSRTQAQDRGEASPSSVRPLR